MSIGDCIENLEILSKRSDHEGFTSSVVVDSKGRRYVLIEDGSPRRFKVLEDIMNEEEVVHRITIGDFEALEAYVVVS